MSIPFSKPYLRADDEEAIVAAFRSTWISGGSYIEEFESKLCDFIEVDFAYAVSNGTAALHLAYLSLGLQPGDEVVIPGYGYLAAANVAILLGIIPVFSDVDLDSFCMRVEHIEKVLTSNTKAIVMIHSYGNIVDAVEISKLCKNRGIALIEDAAEAFGSRINEKHAGTFGDVSTFSFHATKTITTGEGGAIATNSPALANRIKLYRSHGTRAKKYWHEVPGHNFRMTNLQASFGVSQLRKFPEIAEHRMRVSRQYSQNLQNTNYIVQEFEAESNCFTWGMALKDCSSRGMSIRDEIISQMSLKGVECRNGFYTPSKIGWYKGDILIPNSEVLSENILVLPLYPDLLDSEIDYICESLLDISDRIVS